MKRGAGVLLALCSALAFGQTGLGPGPQSGGVSRGNYLPIPQYRTPGTGAQTYYVDPTGADTNACTATGTSACLTIQGALNKVPKLIRDNVTINIAAGTYTAGFTVSGFTEDTGIQQTTAGLTIAGALANSTLATGSATGTAAGAGQTAGSGSTFGTLCDSGASWTASDLIGRFITTTLPTNTGFVIKANTSTCITVTGNWNLPVAAQTTYTIQDPSVIVTGNVALPPTGIGGAAVATRAAVEISDNNIGFRENAIGLQYIRFANATATTSVEITDAASTIVFFNVQFRPTASNANGITVNGVGFNGEPRVAVSKSDISLTSTTSGIFMFSGVLSVAQSLLRNATAASGSAVILGSGSANNSGSLGRLSAYSQVEATGFLNGINVNYGLGGPITNNNITCSGATGVGISVGSPTVGVSNVASSLASINTVSITTCGTGVQIMAPSVVDIITMTGAAGTTGVAVYQGGLVTFPADGGITMTAGTNQINLDSGGATANFTDVTIGTCLQAAATNSKACSR